MPASSSENPHAEWLIGGGETGALIRSLDWSATPLGLRDAWPASLRAVVNVLVASRFPMALLWGRELILLYNDAYREIAAERHPGALGRSTREVWPEVWHINEPIFAAVMQRGETLYFEDKLFPIDRGGVRENAYFTLCYSPVRVEDGTIGGTLVTLQETTAVLAERERLRSERQTALDTFEHGEACIVLDGEYRVILVNREQERISGKPRSTTLGRMIWDVWPDHADPTSPFRQAYDRVMRDRTGVTFEAFFEPLSAWLYVRVHPMANGGLAAFFHDTTARRYAEERIRTSEADLARAQVMAHLGSWRWDLVRDAVSWSDELYRIFGLDPAMSVPSNEAARERIHPDDRDRHAAHVARALAGERVPPFESRIVWPSGEERVVLASGFDVERDPGGRPTALFGTILDITERKRAEEAVRTRDVQLQVLLEELHSGVALIDATGKFSVVNRRFLEIFGLPRDADIANVNSTDWSAWQVFDEAGELLPVDEHPVRKAARTGRPVRDRLVGVRRPRGGPPVWLRVSASVLPLPRGEKRVICTYYEVTEQRRASERLRESEAALDAFFAHSPGILNLEDEEFRYLKTDSTTPTYFGLTRETIVGKAVADLAPQFLEAFGPMMRRVIETGEPERHREVHSPVPGRPGDLHPRSRCARQRGGAPGQGGRSPPGGAPDTARRRLARRYAHRPEQDRAEARGRGRCGAGATDR